MIKSNGNAAARTVNATSWILARCPRWLLWWIARLLARLVVLINGRAAQTTRINLSRCFPWYEPAQIKRMVRDSLTQTAMLGLEAGMVFHFPVDALEAAIGRIDGLQILETALQAPDGVLLLVPHFGNWEFLALFLGRYQLVALYDPPGNEGLERLIRSSRQRTGAQLLPLDRVGLKTAIQTLDRGGLLGILPDQVPDRRAGLHVPFYSHPALTMTLVHRLIRRCEPTLLMGCAIRTEAGFDLSFRKVSTAIADPDPTVALTAMNQEIETLIAQAPEQYQWEYRRFKSPPAGATKIY